MKAEREWFERLPLKVLYAMVDEIVLNCDGQEGQQERRPFVLRVCAEINRRQLIASEIEHSVDKVNEGVVPST